MRTDPAGTVADVPLSANVLDFCRRHDLLDHLTRAIEIARRNFSIVGEPVVRLEQDPEIDEWYLDLEIPVEGEEAECARADREFLRSWVDSTPWPAVHLIRPIFDIVSA